MSQDLRALAYVILFEVSSTNFHLKYCISFEFFPPLNILNWDKEQQSKAQNLDSKYRQMALIGFDT